VALKVLPFAGGLDARQLQRFKNEAQAAACMHHPHIVPVFGVGCERSVHYYAMQLIDGQTLAALIAGLRQAGGLPAPTAAQPTTPHVPAAPAPSAETPPRAAASPERPKHDRAYFRRVAELGIQAAGALDHAHGVGIVHRDVKPANLMVDGRGNLWVTDFGLAHIKSDARLTMTGDVVGTLRYMSPEQALAKGIVDHRTDVYSLGATLYELLTLEPVYNGGDRQELLRQIAFEEPPPPRRINKAIPSELETIVLKALEKNPAERYATAKELADDLRHWCEDRSIRAKRPSLRQRALRWARRHRPLVGAVAAVLALAVLLLAGAVGWVANDRATLHTGVDEALKESVEWQGRGRLPEALSAVRRAEILVKSPSAGEALRRQVTARLKDLRLLETLENARLEGVALTEYKRFDHKRVDALYTQAFRNASLDVEALPPEEGGALLRQTTVTAQLAAILDNWAMIRRGIRGRDDTSWKHFLAVASAADPDAAMARARMVLERRDRQELLALAASEEAFRMLPPTLEVLGYALQEAGAAEQAVGLFREAQRRWPEDFWTNQNLANFLQFGQPPRLEEAIRYYIAAVALRPDSCKSHASLGYVLSCTKDHDGAIAHLRKAIQIDPRFFHPYNNLGHALRAKGDLAGAIAAYQTAIDLDPKSAGAHTNLGVVLREKKDLNGAIAAHLKAIDLDPRFATAHYNLGNALQAKGDGEGAIAAYYKAIDLDPRFAFAHASLGGILFEKKDLNGAIAAYRKALAIEPQRAGVHYWLGRALADKRDFDEAIVEYRKATRLDPKNARFHAYLGEALANKGDPNGAIAELSKATHLDPNFPAAHAELGQVLLSQGHFAEARTAKGRFLELLPQRDPRRQIASRELQQCEHLLELDGKLPAILSGEEQPASDRERAEYADVCQKKRRFAAAARLYQEAITASPDLVVSPVNGLRYAAACAAAQAGCGAGEDTAKLTDAERASLRKQALDWLRGDLDAWRRLLDKGPDKDPPVVAQKMQHLLRDPDFVGLRGPEALGQISEAERQQWQKLWADVADTLAKAQGKTAPALRPEVK